MATRRQTGKRRASTGSRTTSQLRLQNEKMHLQLQQPYCYLCGKHKDIGKFYIDSDPYNHNEKKGGRGASRICSDCFYAICYQNYSGGPKRPVTRDSLKRALFYVNKPFIEDLYNSSVEEAAADNASTAKDDVAKAYIKNVSMQQYCGMTWLDSTMFKTVVGPEMQFRTEDVDEQEMLGSHLGQDVYDSFVKNRNDVQRLLGYDPFEEEAIQDQPFLYSQLLGMIDSDENQNDDMLRISSSISIVRGFLQQSKIDDTITKLMASSEMVNQNAPTIKSLQDSKQKITSMITQLAAESCLSLKNSKHSTKGENTWTGKIRKIKDLNLREGEVNGFDIATSKAMRQVMDASNKSIIHELKCDDSEWASMVADQRNMIYEIDNELSDYKEIARILLRENIDLKDFLRDKDVKYDGKLVDLDELFQDSKTYIIENKDDTEESNGESSG